MAVKVRERTSPKGERHWQADIRVRLENGRLHRERVKAPGRTRAQALRWAKQREAHILRHGPQRKEPAKEAPAVEICVETVQAKRPPTVPRFAEFVPRFMEDHVMANRLSPTTRRSYEGTINSHLNPVLGSTRLDRIGPRHIQALKRREIAASTMNRVLKHLRVILNAAVKWGVLERAPEIKRVKQPERPPRFYDFPEYRRLLRAARVNPVVYAGVRLAGDAGLRSGEMFGLRWENVFVKRGKIRVCANLVRAPGVMQLRIPKGGKTRWAPISAPLERCLKSLERRGPYVLAGRHGSYYSRNTFVWQLQRAQVAAGLEPSGPHILRHTFCSHLVLRGVHARTIQKLAGHADLSTTEAYMHLISEVEEDAIRRLRGDEDVEDLE